MSNSQTVSEYIVENTDRALLDTNSSNLRYHQGLLASRQLQPVPDGRWTPEQVCVALCFILFLYIFALIIVQQSCSGLSLAFSK